jgi:FkbM family methyltransferase
MYNWKKTLKKWADFLPFAITKNQRYDRLTKAIIQTLPPNSIGVDIGSHEGTILQLFIQQFPQVIHYAFEPIPHLYKLLKRKFGSACKVFPYALSNQKGTAKFHVITENPAYSGLLLRQLPGDLHANTIEVETACLDDIIPSNVAIGLIKLDIEGGEYLALLGASRIITQHHPILLFEFGKGAADIYGIEPKTMFQLLQNWNYEIYLLSDYLVKKSSINQQHFHDYFQKGTEYFFVAVYNK